MRQMIVRTVILGIAVIEIVCGIVLLMPWYEGAVSYVYPARSFAMAIFFVGFGGFLLATTTVGFHGLSKTKIGIPLLKGKELEDTKTTQQADAGDALQRA